MRLAPRRWNDPRLRGISLTWNRLVLLILAVLIMGFLDSLVGSLIHPAIGFTDPEHVIVGSLVALMTALLLGGYMVYATRLEKALSLMEEDERKLGQSEEKYRSLFESSRDAIFIEDPDGRFVDINPAGVRMFGYDTRKDLLAADLPRDIYLDYQDFIARRQVMEAGGGLENYEITMKKKSGDPIFVQETSTVVSTT